MADVQEVLRFSAERFGWDTDPGPIDGEFGDALIGNHQKLGLLTPTRLVTLEPKQSIHAYDVATDRSLLEVPIDEAMKLDAIAYYQSAFLRLREHRKNAP